ncbi:MAG: DUF126 domain-containing protein [Candidatus Micrarchaeia archaeon]
MRNSTEIILYGRGLVEGIGEGPALVIKKPFSFAHGIDPKTGKAIDMRQAPEIYGENIIGKVLVYPCGRGSTTGASWFLETVRCGNSPAAIINMESETIIIGGAIQAAVFYGKNIPVVDKLDKNPLEVIETGDYVKVEVKGKTGVVIVRKS